MKYYILGQQHDSLFNISWNPERDVLVFSFHLPRIKKGNITMLDVMLMS